jgi:hypothetical protein
MFTDFSDDEKWSRKPQKEETRKCKESADSSDTELLILCKWELKTELRRGRMMSPGAVATKKKACRAPRSTTGGAEGAGIQYTNT